MPSKTAEETWSAAPDLNTRIAAIDADQQQLLKLIYQAHRLAEQGASTTQLLQHARDLIVFPPLTSEEKIMQAAKHPALEASLAAQHKTLQNLQHDFNERAFNRESIGDFFIFLKDCLITHITDTNKNWTAFDNTLNNKISDILAKTGSLTNSHCVNIYIVDDEQQHVDLMVEMISIAGLAAKGFTSGRLFINQPIANNDIILLDLNMPEMDGIEVMRTLYN